MSVPGPLDGLAVPTGKKVRPPADRGRQRRLTLWAGIAVEESWGLEWNMVLVPEMVHPSLRLDNNAVQVYQRLTWLEEPNAGEIELTATRRWVRTRRTGVEHGLQVEAATGSRCVAQSLLAIIDGTGASEMGTSMVPPAPTGSYRGQVYEAMLADADVRFFAEESGAHYLIHEDASAARRAGHAGAIIQSTALYGLLVRSGYGRKPATVEMWFRAPVLTGSVVSVRNLVDDDGRDVVEMSTTGRAGPSAASARISAPSFS